MTDRNRDQKGRFKKVTGMTDNKKTGLSFTEVKRQSDEIEKIITDTIDEFIHLINGELCFVRDVCYSIGGFTGVDEKVKEFALSINEEQSIGTVLHNYRKLSKEVRDCINFQTACWVVLYVLYDIHMVINYYDSQNIS